MSRASISATPCPAPYSTAGLPISRTSRRDSLASCQTDDTLTTDLDYTRADVLQQEFRTAHPKRKSAFMRTADRRAAGITIFEDVLEDQEMAGFEEALPKPPGNTLLSRKAIRAPVQGTAVVKRVEEGEPRGRKALGEMSQARSQYRAPVIALRSDNDAAVVSRGVGLTGKEQGKEHSVLKKDPRRRTIFVPADDTTMLTIHPGADTTARLNDTFQIPGISATYSGPAMQQQSERIAVEDKIEPLQRPRRPRMSLNAAPKRVPLQQMTAYDANVLNVDVDGLNGGKENLAPKIPNLLSAIDDKPAKAVARPFKRKLQSTLPDKVTAPSSRLFEPTAASQARQSVMARNAVPLKRPPISVKTHSQRQSVAASTHAAKLHSSHVTASKPSSVDSPRLEASPASSTDCKDNGATRERASLRAFRGPAPKTSRLLQYAVLSEDVAQPQLYEESWLDHQEISLTELVNDIFENVKPPSFDGNKDQAALREHMIAIYHQPQVSTLHKRLQASLLYGALARPKDATSLPHPAHDIGLRKQFLGLWLNNYTENALRAAAEVVTGRQAPRKSRSLRGGLESSETLLDPAKSRRALTGFLETFLVTVDDVAADDELHGTGDLSGQRWRKTILRSLMLIWLLDQAKSSGHIENCLFRRTATKKSSMIILNWLATMLMPGTGDISRTLHYLDYEVSHVQDPLDEVVYRIENLATDLRDGIILSRLVEILLFSLRNVAQSQQSTVEEATVTIQMPDASVLQSARWTTDGSHGPRVLSQHLKMPCLGRAQRLYNVQISLSALADVSKTATQDLAADDIVDGHREKTIHFLWTLVSSHGLSTLVDWEVLQRDVRRASQTIDLLPPPSPSSHAEWLKAWAAVHSKRAGLTITNLTTSFANGDAYSAIVDAFTSSLPCRSSPSQSASGKPGLETNLRALGCSTPFIRQLTTPLGLIPSETTTVSNLAFLASRLLPLALRQNAAITLQRLFRCRQAKVLVSKRVALMRLAHACAAVVGIRQNVINAAVVLQRSWRTVLHARIERLSCDATGFQALARAWKVRRVVQGAMGRAGARSQSGW
nr:protein abnormal spindle [Quercus suber]